MKLIKKTWQLLLLFSVAFAMAATANAAGYEIHGTLKGKLANATEAKLTDESFETIATTQVVDGKFTFTGKVDKPTFARLIIDGRRQHRVILEDANIEAVIGDVDDFSVGGKYHNLVYGYVADPAYIAARKEVARVMAIEIDAKSEREAEEQSKELMVKAGKARDKIKDDYGHAILQGDYPALVKFWVLMDNFDWDRYPMADRLQMAMEFQKEIKGYNTLDSYVEVAQKRLKQKEFETNVLAPGKPYLPVVAKTVDGKDLALADVLKNNKLVLLEFWASWCGPCRAEFPHLKRVYQKYHDKGFEIYAVSVDAEHDDWVEALEEENVPWVNTADYGGASESKSAVDYAVTGVPASFLIKSDGTFLGSGFRGYKLDDALKEFFGE